MRIKVELIPHKEETDDLEAGLNGWKPYERHILYSVLAIILILVIICLSVLCPRIISEKNLGFDYMGVIVGILSLLVTFLIGWNIYSVIDIRKIKKENKKQLEDITHAFNSSICEMHALALFYDLKNPKEAFEYLFEALREVNKSSIKDTLEGIVTAFTRIKNDFQKLKVDKTIVSFSKEKIELYCDIIKKTENKDAISLIDFIKSLQK